MTRQRYSEKESLNRVLRILENKALPTDTPEGLTGEVLSTNEALSDLAELMAGSLPNESFVMPSGIDLSNYWASDAVSLLGVSDVLAMTPGTHAYVHDAWGQLYTNTGTCTMENLTASTDTMVTGVFQNEYCDGVGVLINPTNHGQLRITKNGIYQITWKLNIQGSSALTYTVTPYLNSGSKVQAVGSCTPNSSGSSTLLMGDGYLYVSGTNVSLDLRINPSATGWFVLKSAQLCATRVSKLK